jgi:hypothetical protein
MSKVPQVYLLDNPKPIPIANPKSWADIVDTDDAKPQDSAPWTDAEFKNWCRLMGFKDTMTTTAGNIRQIRDQYLLFDKLRSNLVAQGSASSSFMVAHSATEKSVAVRNPTSHITSTGQSVPKQTLSLGVSEPTSLKGSPMLEEPAFSKNERVNPLTQIKPEFRHSNPHEIDKLILSPSVNFIQKNPAFTQQYYEFIFTDTKSCLFQPHKDKQTQSYVTHTSIWIIKIISPTEWGTHPSKHKRLSQPFDPQFYNYYNNQAA